MAQNLISYIIFMVNISIHLNYLKAQDFVFC
jgi:hypothetical protein